MVQYFTMENIIIVECTSSATEYVRDARELGYNPVILEVFIDNPETLKVCEAFRRQWYKQIQAPLPEIIRDTGDFEILLSSVSAYEPVAVIPGHELGVALASRLSEALNLPGNPVHIIPGMIEKYEMHKALKDAGLRYIRSRKIKSTKEALSFYREIKKSVVIKPDIGGGSIGCHICHSEDEIIKVTETELSSFNMYGDKNETLLIQEFIDGKEYVIDTISQDGKHYFEFAAYYKKNTTHDGRKVYDITYYMKRDAESDTLRELIFYAFKVLDVIGIVVGPVHGEFMIDNDGIVLMEINCRPCGSTPREFSDQIIGTHETLLGLKAYLGMDLSEISTLPKEEQTQNSPAKTYKSGLQKLIIVPENMTVESAPILEWVKELPSYHSTEGIDGVFPRELPRTVDLATDGGMVYLLNSDEEALWADYKKIKDAEQNSFEKIYKYQSK